MQVYNVRKLHFQEKLCELFAEDKQQHYCEDLVLGWGEEFCKRLFSIISKQDFHQNFRKSLT